MLGTCSITNPKDNCVTFARSKEWLKKLEGCQLHVGVYVPTRFDPSGIDLPETISISEFDYSEYEFCRLHNSFNFSKEPAQDVYGVNFCFHPSSVIGEGLKLCLGPNGKKLQMKAVGNVVFGDDVYIGPLCLIERAQFDSTIIKDGVKIDNLVNIGHNCVIGDRTVISTGAIVAGSAIVGKDCWIGLNATIRNGVKVCDKVVVGMCSAVVKDITESGIYAGNPAKKIKEYVEGWSW